MGDNNKFLMVLSNVGDGAVSKLKAAPSYVHRSVPVNVWEQQPRETGPAYEAFSLYRDMGIERTVAAVAKTLDRNLRRMYGWSKHWDWDGRVRAWDTAQDRIKAEAAAEEMKVMGRRQARVGRKMQELAEKRVDQYLNSEDLQASMTVTDIAKMASEGAKLERAAVGADTTDGAKGPAVVLVFEGNQPKWLQGAKQDAPRQFQTVDGEARLLPAPQQNDEQEQEAG